MSKVGDQTIDKLVFNALWLAGILFTVQRSIQPHATNRRNHKITSYILRFPLSFVVMFVVLLLSLHSLLRAFFTSSMVCDALGAYYEVLTKIVVWVERKQLAT